MINKNIKGLASGQIFLIVLSVFAFAFIMGGAENVSAENVIITGGSNNNGGSFILENNYVIGSKTFLKNVLVEYTVLQGTGNFTFTQGDMSVILSAGKKDSLFRKFEEVENFNTAETESDEGEQSESALLGGSLTNSLVEKVTKKAQDKIGKEIENKAKDFLEGDNESKNGDGKDAVKSGFAAWNPWGETPFGLTGTGAHLAAGATWAISAYFLVSMGAEALGQSEAQAHAIGMAAAVGVGVWKFLSASGGGGAVVWGLGAGVVVLLLMYKSEKAEIIQFQCLPWEAPLGGEYCEDCNVDEFRPCSEYRCRSLGQACELLNKGSKEEKCTWVNPNDVNAPTIETWNDALTEGHSYSPHATLPEDRGTKIVREDSLDGCLQAFTPLEFGVITNEPAQCKIDVVHTETLEEMNFYMDENNYFLYNHSLLFAKDLLEIYLILKQDFSILV